MISPRVRESFAIRLRRNSAAEGRLGVVGVWAVEGVFGVLGEARLAVDDVVGVEGEGG